VHCSLNDEHRFYSRLLKSDKREENWIASFVVTDFSAFRRFISGPSGEAPAEHGREIKMECRMQRAKRKGSLWLYWDLKFCLAIDARLSSFYICVVRKRSRFSILYNLDTVWNRFFVHGSLIDEKNDPFYSRLLRRDKKKRKKNCIGSSAVTDFSAFWHFISGPSGEAPAEHGREIKMECRMQRAKRKGSLWLYWNLKFYLAIDARLSSFCTCMARKRSRFRDRP